MARRVGEAGPGRGGFGEDGDGAGVYAGSELGILRPWTLTC